MGLKITYTIDLITLVRGKFCKTGLSGKPGILKLEPFPFYLYHQKVCLIKSNVDVHLNSHSTEMKSALN